MTEEQWREVDALFESLFVLTAEDRQKALSGIEDMVVRNLLASLLENAGTGSIDTKIGAAIGAAAAELTAEEPECTRVGPWRLLKRLGEGGQGTVFESARDDGAFEQRVAVKILKREMDSAAARRRFRRERQVLAALEHPNIARLLDGGESGGLPWLVMEYIEGRPLMEATIGWALPRKISLFVQIVDAVAFAHRNLVVHRDLKPSNILITGPGDAKLLDFGISGLIDGETGGPVRVQTATSSGMLTPDYASPEQVRGETAGIASDIYSLGAILFELLTASRPHSLRNYSTADIYQAICVDPPPVPSDRAAPDDTKRHLRGDLDTLVVKAMAKDPAERYLSAEALAGELRRYLEGRPIEARRPPALERAWKFTRRNRLAVGASAAVILAVGAGSALALQQARVAKQRFEQVRKLAHSFVFDFQDDLARVEGNTAVRERMVRTALEYLDNLSKSSEGDIELQKELAAAYEKVGDAQGSPTRPNLGHTDQAIASYRKAALLRERIAGRDPEYRESLVDFYADYTQVLRLAGASAEAREMGEATLRSAEQQARKRPDDEKAQLAVAKSWCSLGDLDEDVSRSAAAFEKNTRCNTIAGAILSRWHDRDALWWAENAEARVGTTAVATARIDLGLQAFDRAERLVGELLTREPANPLYLRSLAILAQFKGLTWYDDEKPSLNDPVRSLEYMQEYLRLSRLRAERDPTNASAQFSVAIALFSVSKPLKFSDSRAALLSARESLRLFDAQIASGKSDHLFISRRARGLRYLAEALLAEGGYTEASDVAARALSEQRKVTESAPRDMEEASELAFTLLAAAAAADAVRDWGKAAGFLTEAERRAAASLSSDPRELRSLIPMARVFDGWGQHCLRLGDSVQARLWFARRHKLWVEFPEKSEFVRRKEAEGEGPEPRPGNSTVPRLRVRAL